MDLIKKIDKLVGDREKLLVQLATETKQLKDEHAKLISVIKEIDQEKDAHRVAAKNIVDQLVNDPLNLELIKQLQELEQVNANDRKDERESLDINSKKLEQLMDDLLYAGRKL